MKQIIKHSRYDPKVSTNDIALLQLDQPVAMNSGVATINLPRPGTSPPAGWMCVVTGTNNALLMGRNLTYIFVGILEYQSHQTKYNT